MEPTMHPNLAKLAAAYDEITGRYGRGQINAAEARAEILTLEARDDEGVRWNIDPDTGDWTRRTALGAAAADTPPQWGYKTPDAFDFTTDSAGFNPSDRISEHEVDEATLYAPVGLAGSTRTPPAAEEAPEGGWRATLAGVSKRTKIIVAGVVVVIVALIARGSSSPATSTPLPHPGATVTAPATVVPTTAAVVPPVKAKPKPGKAKHAAAKKKPVPTKTAKK